MAGTFIGDAIIKIVVDPSAANASVDGQKGNEKPRPAEKSPKPRKRTDGEGSETQTPDTAPPEEEAVRVSAEDERRLREDLREEVAAKRERKKRVKAGETETKRATKETQRAALRGRAARMAVAGRATRRLLNRTVPTVGRAATIGKQAAQTVAPAAGLAKAGPIGAAVGAAAGVVTGATVYGHQINQLLAGLTGTDVGNAVEIAVLSGMFPLFNVLRFAAPETADDIAGEVFGTARTLMDIKGAVGAGLGAAGNYAKSAGVIASLGGQTLDGEHTAMMSGRAGRNAAWKSMHQKGMERTIEGMGAKGTGSALNDMFTKMLTSGNAQR